MPPSLRVMTMVASRGTVTPLGPPCWGKLLTDVVPVTGMLHVDERRAPVGGDREAGDLAAGNTGEQPLELPGFDVGDQQLVVEAVLLATVGLDEQAPVGVSPDTVGVGEALLGAVSGPGEYGDVPLEGRAGVAGRLRPADDVAVGVGC